MVLHKTNKDKPAFPISEEETDRILEGVPIYTGLTKREYFTALAMQSLITQRKVFSYQAISENSVELADTVLKELNK